MPGAAQNLPHLDPPLRLLDAAGLAARLSVTTQAVRSMLKRRQIPEDAIVHLGRRLRFDEVAVTRWIGWLRAESAEKRTNPKRRGGGVVPPKLGDTA